MHIKMFGKCVFIIAVACLLSVVHCAKLPDFIKKCKNGPTLNDCIKENMEICREHLADGIPQLSVPKLVPFMFPKVALETDSYTFELTDVSLLGMADYQLAEVDFQVGEKDIKAHMEIVFPKLTMHSKYSLKGQVLTLQLNGHGDFRGNSTNLLAKIDFSGKIADQNGKEHIVVETGKVVLIWKGVTWGYFDDLFGDRKDLTEATNQMIAENINDFIGELGPITEQVILSVVMGILKPMTAKFPLYDLIDK